MDITPPRDTHGTESLARENAREEVRQPAETAPIRRVETKAAPTPPQERERERPATPSARPDLERRSGIDRRSGYDRRFAGSDEGDPSFDTRNYRERRTYLRRQEDRERAAEEGTRVPPRGIDLKA